MTLEEFNRFLLTKSSGRNTIPINESMIARVHSALKRLAMDVVSLKWIVNDPEGYQIIRRLDDHSYVRIPRRPISESGQELDLEEVLEDALAYYVLAGLEFQRSKILMGLYYKEVDSYNDKLTETYLSEASNDASRFYAFP